MNKINLQGKLTVSHIVSTLTDSIICETTLLCGFAEANMLLQVVYSRPICCSGCVHCTVCGLVSVVLLVMTIAN